MTAIAPRRLASTIGGVPPIVTRPSWPDLCAFRTRDLRVQDDDFALRVDVAIRIDTCGDPSVPHVDGGDRGACAQFTGEGLKGEVRARRERVLADPDRRPIDVELQCDERPNEEQDTAAMMITKATTPPATSVSLCHSRDRRGLAIQPSPTGTMSKLT
jgi:hypothetical protein